MPQRSEIFDHPTIWLETPQKNLQYSIAEKFQPNLPREEKMLRRRKPPRKIPWFHREEKSGPWIQNDDEPVLRSSGLAWCPSGQDRPWCQGLECAIVRVEVEVVERHHLLIYRSPLLYPSWIFIILGPISNLVQIVITSINSQNNISEAWECSTNYSKKI